MPMVSFRLRPRSVKWAATYLGTSEDHVRAAIRSGELKYVDLHGRGAGGPIQGDAFKTTLEFLDEYILKRSRMIAAAKARPTALPPSQVIRLMEDRP